MNCNETQSWLHGYLDGELDLVRAVEVERHLEDCDSCAQAHENQRVLRDSIHTAALYEKCPNQLRARIRAALPRSPASRRQNTMRHWLAIAACGLAMVGVSWLAWRGGFERDSLEPIAQQVVDDHVRSLLGDHLFDVASSDRHTVKPWFNGRLDFAPSVADLASDGFPLVGGRLDYLNHRTVAALVYMRRQHVINLFVWPTSDADQSPTPATLQGFHLLHWVEADTNYWAVSDLNHQELAQFAAQVREFNRDNAPR